MAFIQLFRIDDISWDMNYENFSRMRDLFFQYDIHPIIGIIPYNEDSMLKEQAGKYGISQEQFWEEMRSLQQDHGWAVALHGYNHVYITDKSGIWGANPQSEFAGLSFPQQEEKIRRGKAVLEENGLRVDAFMAPSHTLDWNTVKALKENSITVVTDGLTVYPYQKKGVLFVPQVWSRPCRRPFGIYTTCFHINLWKDSSFQEIEKFIRKNRNHCGDFLEIVRQSKFKRHTLWGAANVGFHWVIVLEKRLRKWQLKGIEILFQRKLQISPCGKPKDTMLSRKE